MSFLRRILRPVRAHTGPITWGTRSYAQEGEDLIVKRLLDDRRRGFYVEVGCHHPFRFSNTYLFYRRGWRGICIDPLPGTVRSFRRWRPRDITLELGVSRNPAVLTYHMFDEPALNTFDSTAAHRVHEAGTYRMVGTRQVDVEPLERILGRHLPTDTQVIDFLSVDVEGLDLEVLRSNDWGRYAPRVVIAECLDSDLLGVHEDPVVLFMSEVGYRPYAKTGNSVIFSRAP